jgi:hypothetical protein
MIFQMINPSLVSFHHKSIESRQPIMPDILVIVHQRNSKLSFLHISMHNFDNQSILMEIKSRPKISHTTCLHRICIGIVDVSISEKPFGGNYCISHLPFLQIFGFFPNVTTDER